MLFQLIIIQVITFLAIVFVLRKMLYVETARETERLKALKEENVRKQRDLQQKIEEAENIYGKKLVKAENEIRKFRTSAEEEIEEIRRKMIDGAKEESERIVKAAFNAKEKIREEIVLQTEEKIPVRASRIFTEVLSSGAKELIHKELIRKVIGEVKKLRLKVKIKEGELTSAYPLEEKEKEEILSIIFEGVGYKITFKEREDKELLAGIVIRLDTLVIDGSLENRLRQIEQGSVQGSGDRVQENKN